MAEIIKTADFEAKVKNADKPVLVDFYADWCGPCKMLAPTVEKLAEAFAGKADVYKVNTDADGALAAGFGIISIPTLIFFKNGEEVNRLVGYVQETAIREILEALC